MTGPLVRFAAGGIFGTVRVRNALVHSPPGSTDRLRPLSSASRSPYQQRDAWSVDEIIVSFGGFSSLFLWPLEDRRRPDSCPSSHDISSRSRNPKHQSFFRCEEERIRSVQCRTMGISHP